jgi:hypothetical protein
MWDFHVSAYVTMPRGEVFGALHLRWPKKWGYRGISGGWRYVYESRHILPSREFPFLLKIPAFCKLLIILPLFVILVWRLLEIWMSQSYDISVEFLRVVPVCVEASSHKISPKLRATSTFKSVGNFRTADRGDTNHRKQSKSRTLQRWHHDAHSDTALLYQEFL